VIENPVQKELYVQECANLFGVSETNIFRSLQALKKKSWKPKNPLNLHVDPYHEEKDIIKLILSYPERCADYFDDIEVDYFTHPLIRKLFKLFKTKKIPIFLLKREPISWIILIQKMLISFLTFFSPSCHFPEIILKKC